MVNTQLDVDQCFRHYQILFAKAKETAKKTTKKTNTNDSSSCDSGKESEGEQSHFSEISLLRQKERDITEVPSNKVIGDLTDEMATDDL